MPNRDLEQGSCKSLEVTPHLSASGELAWSPLVPLFSSKFLRFVRDGILRCNFDWLILCPVTSRVAARALTPVEPRTLLPSLVQKLLNHS